MQQVAGDRVQGRERLVHEQQGAVLGEGPGQGDALAHAAGELVGSQVGGVVEVDEAQQLPGTLPTLPRGHTGEAEGELDVAAGGEPREEGGVLEHERGPLPGGLDDARGGRL